MAPLPKTKTEILASLGLKPMVPNPILVARAAKEKK